MRFWVACLGLALIGLPDGALGVAWPSMRVALSWTDKAVALPQAALGLVLACLACGTFGAGLVAGRLLAAHGTRRVLAGAALVAATGLAAEAAAPGLAMLCAGAAVLGFGAGTLDSGVNAAAAFGFDARRVNWMHGCYGLGAMAGPLAITAIVVRAGLSWRLGYALLSVILLAASGLFARTVSGAAGDAAAVGGDGRRRTGGALAAARHPLVRLQVVLFFVYTGLEVMLGQWSFSVLTAGHGVTPAAAGGWTAAYWASLAAGRFALGALVARIGADRLLRLCTLGVLAGVLGFALAPGVWAGLGLMVAGAALAPIFPTLIARAPERLGPAVALHAVGFKVSAAMAGGAALPAIAGALVDAAGLAAVGWCAVAAALVLIALHEMLVARSPTLATR